MFVAILLRLCFPLHIPVFILIPKFSFAPFAELTVFKMPNLDGSMEWAC